VLAESSKLVALSDPELCASKRKRRNSAQNCGPKIGSFDKCMRPSVTMHDLRCEPVGLLQTCLYGARRIFPLLAQLKSELKLE